MKVDSLSKHMDTEKEWEQAWLDWSNENRKKEQKLWLKNFINKYRKALLRLSGKRCPKCDGKLDYDHIGYKGDRGYCHNCKWQDAKSICEEGEL